MLQEKFTELISNTKLSALIGIGISLTFMFSFYGITLNIKIWVGYIFFGSLVGILIGLANSSLKLIFTQKLPDSKLYTLLELVLTYVISCTIFYLTGLIFFFLLALPEDYLLYISLAVGIPSSMINLFFTFLNEKEAEIKLEQENKELAVIEERNRIAREIHDSVSQNLFGITLNLKSLEHTLNNNPQQTPEVINQLRSMVQEVQTEMRLMIYELKPFTFQERDFLEAVTNLLSLFEKRHNLNITFNTNQQEIKLNQKIKLNLYRIIQETLHNIVQHTQTEKVKINLKLNNKIKLIIAADGISFNQKETDLESNFGLQNIKERTAKINGELIINSNQNKGVEIIITTAGDRNERRN